MAEEREDFESVVSRHERWALALALSVTQEVLLAQDIVQEAFVRLWRAYANDHGPTNVRAWLRTVVLNCCRDELRRRAVRNDPVNLLHLHSLYQAGDGGSTHTRALCAKVWAAVGRLPPQQRVAFVLTVIEGLPSAQVASTLGITPGAVRRYCALARATIRAQADQPEG